MTDLSELLLIMILMRYQFTATMSNIVPQHSITEKRQLGPASHAEIHNSISDYVRQYRDIIVMSALSPLLLPVTRHGLLSQNTNIFSLQTKLQRKGGLF